MIERLAPSGCVPSRWKGTIMAFIDFKEPVAASTIGFGEAVSAFEPQEWRVIELARKDRLTSLREPGRWERALAWMFGEGVNPRLADSRLETLRQIAVQAWHRGYAVPVSSIKAFKQAGFTIDQLELLLASIGAGRMASNGRVAR
jgi:hypothetical protein